MTRQQKLAWDIANAAGRDERNFQRAIGASWENAYAADVRTGNEVYELAMAPERTVYFRGHYFIRRLA